MDKAQGGKDEIDNLRMLFRICNQGAKNIVQEPPGFGSGSKGYSEMTNRKVPPPKRLESARSVRVKSHSYQSSKAELEGPVEIRKPGAPRPTMDEFVDSVLKPV